MPGVSPFAVPPAEAIQWLREKGYRLGFDWRDTWQEEHARAFTVARATQLDVLADIRDAVDAAIANGTTLGTFRTGLRPLLQARGWWGEQDVVDPVTGETVTTRLGTPRRLRTIYETNLRQAQAAGRWERMQRTQAARPYARYVAIMDGRARDEHAAWHGLILPLDDPWWDTHAPPNGWGCRCKLQQLSDADLKRYGWSVGIAPKVEYRAWENGRTGQTMRVPVGIDPGFAYNPGRATRGYQPERDQGVPLDGNQTAASLGLPSRATLLRGAAERRLETWPRAAVTRRFTERFGSGDQASVADADGEQVLVSRAMVDRGDATLLPAAMTAVSDPDEVWLTPRRVGSVVVMQKVYVRAVSGGQTVVATRDRAGFLDWHAVASEQLDQWRQGYLTFQRSSQ